MFHVENNALTLLVASSSSKLLDFLYFVLSDPGLSRVNELHTLHWSLCIVSMWSLKVFLWIKHSSQALIYFIKLIICFRSSSYGEKVDFMKSLGLAVNREHLDNHDYGEKLRFMKSLGLTKKIESKVSNNCSVKFYYDRELEMAKEMEVIIDTALLR